MVQLKIFQNWYLLTVWVGFFAVACKLSTPNGFLDNFPAALTSGNIRNISTNLTAKTPDLYSGFVIGTLPDGATVVKVAFDDGAYKAATTSGTTWKIALPTGPDAASGTKRWQVGSKHTLYAKSYDAQGNTKMSSPYSLSFVRQQNRDVNGDGYDDVVMGAYLNTGASAAGGQSAGNTGRGSIYVFYGSAAGLTNHPENATAYFCSGPPDCSVIANPDNKANSNFGLNNAAIAGDVNGDGYADIVVGATANDGSSAAGGQIAGILNSGAAYVFYGSATGVTNHPENASPYFCSGAPDCSVVKNPDNSGNTFGYAAAAAGDVNGDGYGDVIISANLNNGSGAAGGQTAGQVGVGAAYIFYGSTSGITNHPENNTAYFCSGAPDCSVLENPDQHNNGSNNGEFGHSVAAAGDINGDGYSDVIVGAVGNDGRATVAGGQVWGGDSKGAAYIFYGSSTGITNHPENATAYFCSGPPDCSVIQNPDDLNTTAASFGSAVAGGGDINGDGYADVVVGAYFNDGTRSASPQSLGASQKGAAYVFYGSATGVTNHPENTIAYYCSGPPDCSVMQNPDNKGGGAGNFGVSVAMLGDTNGDGYADILVGAFFNDGTSAATPQSASGQASKGAAYIFYGSSTGTKIHPENATAYFCSGAPDCSVIQNPDNTGGNFGLLVAMAGDVNNDGYADLVVGSPLNNGASSTGGQSAGAVSKGTAYLFFGAASGVTNHPINASPYFCAGTSDCAVIQNPDNNGGKFGNGVGWLAPALRPSPNQWRQELTLMPRREEVEA